MLEALPDEVLRLVISYVAQDSCRGAVPCAPVEALALAATSRRLRRAVAHAVVSDLSWIGEMFCHAPYFLAWLRLAGAHLRHLALPECFGGESAAIYQHLAHLHAPILSLDISSRTHEPTRADISATAGLAVLLRRVRPSLTHLALALDGYPMLEAVCDANLVNVTSLAVHEVKEPQGESLMRLLASLNNGKLSSTRAAPHLENSALRKLSLVDAVSTPTLPSVHALGRVSPGIEELEICGWPKHPSASYDCSSLLVMSEHLPSLTTLSLKDVVQIEWGMLHPLLQPSNRRGVVALELGNCENFFDFHEVIVGASCRLRQLELDTTLLSENDLQEIADRCKSLDRLGCSLVMEDLQALPAVCDRLPELYALSLSICSDGRSSCSPETAEASLDSLVEATTTMRSLGELTVNHNTRFVLNARQLQRIMIAGGQELTILSVASTLDTSSLSAASSLLLLQVAAKHNPNLCSLTLPIGWGRRTIDLKTSSALRAAMNVLERVAIHIDIHNLRRALAKKFDFELDW